MIFSNFIKKYSYFDEFFDLFYDCNQLHTSTESVRGVQKVDQLWSLHCFYHHNMFFDYFFFIYAQLADMASEVFGCPKLFCKLLSRDLNPPAVRSSNKTDFYKYYIRSIFSDANSSIAYKVNVSQWYIFLFLELTFEFLKNNYSNNSVWL